MSIVTKVIDFYCHRFQLKSLSEQHQKSIFQIQELKMKLSEVADDQKVQVKNLNLNEVEEKVSSDLLSLNFFYCFMR